MQFYKPGKPKLVIVSMPTVHTRSKKMIASGKKTSKNAKSFLSKMATKILKYESTMMCHIKSCDDLMIFLTFYKCTNFQVVMT